jgi:hypothetical protein
MKTIVTKTQQFYNGAILELEVGTTGLCGGDTGHGGRTYLRFKDIGGTDIRVTQDTDGEVTLIFGGDGELKNLIAGLQFALDALKESEDNGARGEPLRGARNVA